MYCVQSIVGITIICHLTALSFNLSASLFSLLTISSPVSTLFSTPFSVHRKEVFSDPNTLISKDSVNRELEQAVRFLHDNGTMLHFEDPMLQNFYFVDPQWLCDVMAHVVTVREINPFIRDGMS